MGGSLSYRLSYTTSHEWWELAHIYFYLYCHITADAATAMYPYFLMFYCVLWCVSVYNNLNITCCCVIPLPPCVTTKTAYIQRASWLLITFHMCITHDFFSLYFRSMRTWHMHFVARRTTTRSTKNCPISCLVWRERPWSLNKN